MSSASSAGTATMMSQMYVAGQATSSSQSELSVSAHARWKDQISSMAGLRLTAYGPVVTSAVVGSVLSGDVSAAPIAEKM